MMAKPVIATCAILAAIIRDLEAFENNRDGVNTGYHADNEKISITNVIEEEIVENQQSLMNRRLKELSQGECQAITTVNDPWLKWRDAVIVSEDRVHVESVSDVPVDHVDFVGIKAAVANGVRLEHDSGISVYFRPDAVSGTNYGAFVLGAIDEIAYAHCMGGNDPDANKANGAEEFLFDSPIVGIRAWTFITGSPTTGSPTTGSPTTGSPTTGSPISGSPTTGSPTASPTTDSPTTGSPTTGSPTGSPTTGSPTTGSPTGSPTTGSPTTGSPTGSPTTGSPTTGSPTGSPTTGAPIATERRRRLLRSIGGFHDVDLAEVTGIISIEFGMSQMFTQFGNDPMDYRCAWFNETGSGRWNVEHQEDSTDYCSGHWNGMAERMVCDCKGLGFFAVVADKNAVRRFPSTPETEPPTEPSSESPGGSSSGDNLIYIVIGVAGGAVLLVILGVICYLRCRRGDDDSDDWSDDYDYSQDDTDDSRTDSRVDRRTRTLQEGQLWDDRIDGRQRVDDSWGQNDDSRERWSDDIEMQSRRMDDGDDSNERINRLTREVSFSADSDGRINRGTREIGRGRMDDDDDSNYRVNRGRRMSGRVSFSDEDGDRINRHTRIVRRG